MGILGVVINGVKKAAMKAAKTRALEAECDGVEDTAYAVSKEAEQVTKDAVWELKKFGLNIAGALEEGIFRHQMVCLSRAVFIDLLEEVEHAARVARHLEESPAMLEAIQDLMADLERGRLHQTAACAQVMALTQSRGAFCDFRSMTLGVRADLPYFRRAVGSTGVAVNRKHGAARSYSGYSVGLETSTDGLPGVEVGYWVDAPDTLDGGFIAVSFGTDEEGAEVSMYFALGTLQFLGFIVVPTTRAGIRITTGETKMYSLK